jgi:hypothetical protein
MSTSGGKVHFEKKIAIIVGSLFIITMIVGMFDAYFVAPILKTPLSNIYPNDARVITGAFLIIAMSVGIVGIAVCLYPILKRYSEMIAISYVSFRVIECILLLVGSLVYLFLIGLSQEYINAGTPNAAYFNASFGLAIKLRYVAYQIAMIILGFGSMFLCYLLFQSKLVPRFLSVWGLIGYALLFASGLLDVLGVVDTVNGTGALLYIPGGLWELFVFPIWLIVKGFNSSTISNENV